jgi:DNA-binding GntR family transcriptional regulator
MSPASRRELLVSSERPNEGLPDYLEHRYGWGAIRGRDAVIQAVIDRVVQRKLGIGQMSSEKELAAELGMSRTPLREALAVLSRDGLIRQIPQVGFFVVRVDEDDVLETITMRRGIEPVIARQLAEGRPEAAHDLVEILDSILGKMEGASEPHLGERDTQFHVHLAAAAGFSNGARTLVSWRNQVRIFRAERPLTKDERDAIISEHRAVVEAIRSGRPDTAAEAADDHLVATAERLSQKSRSRERSAAGASAAAAHG